MSDDDALTDELEEEFEGSDEEEFEEQLDLQTLRQLSTSRTEHLLSELVGQQSFVPKHRLPVNPARLSLSELYKKAQQQNLLSPQPNYA